MNVTTRLVSALLVAAMLALPGVGSDGGENAGGTGVWILPRASFLSAAPVGQVPLPVPTSDFVSPVSVDLALTTASEMGSFTATLIDQISGAPLLLPTNGRNVILTRGTLQGLLAAGTTVAHVLIADANQLGYVVGLSIDPATGAVKLAIR